jgi:antitoxin component YwqK of YwqJK toxin-antitoxin module
MPVAPIIPRIEVIEDGVRVVTEGGILRSKIPVGDGICRWFHENGTVSHEYEKVNGQTHGKFRQWYETGELQSEKVYVAGEIQGVWRSFNRDGSISQELQYVTPEAIHGKSYLDSNGRFWNIYLWNGKPRSREKWMNKLVAAGLDREELECKFPSAKKRSR